MKRITIKDIARELKLHHSTVSRALRNEKIINSETRGKVIEYAREHGYLLNLNALQLRGNANNVIGLVVPNINHSFFSNYISFISNLAFEKGYIISVFQSNESLQQEKEFIKTLIQHNVAGVMASISMETGKAQHFELLKKYNIPFVMFDRVDFSLGQSGVVINNSEVVSEVVAMLFSKGFRKIAYISGTPSTNVFIDRQKGYTGGLAKFGLKYKNCIAIHKGFTIEKGKQVIDTLFGLKDCPDAIICDSHILTLVALAKIQELGLRVSENFGLAGFGGFPDLALVSKGVIFIQQPEKEMAEAAFSLLMEEILNKEKVNTKQIKTFQAEIIDTSKIKS